MQLIKGAADAAVRLLYLLFHCLPATDNGVETYAHSKRNSRGEKKIVMIYMGFVCWLYR